MLTPDTAHGTNPATVTMAGYEVVKVATDERGGVDLDDLRAKADDEVACLMLTNPNTLGLFDENIAEIASIVHDVGGTLYYDGANLNAIMGFTRPGEMGFDIVHVNLHKSFSQPHGGGGPGAGPIAVSERIAPFLPAPRIVCDTGGNGAGPTFGLDYELPKSIGRMRGFQGNFGVFVRSFAYITSLGGDGLREASETAVLNANYLLAKLRAGRAGKHLPVAFDRRCMHEFVLSGAPAKRELGVTHARRRQAPARLRVPPADDLLPAARRRGADGRADRDRDTGVARLCSPMRSRDPRRGGAGSRDRPHAPVHDPGPPSRRGRREPQTGPPPAAVAARRGASGLLSRWRARPPTAGSGRVRATSRRGRWRVVFSCLARVCSRPTISAVGWNGSASARPLSSSIAARSSPSTSPTITDPRGGLAESSSARRSSASRSFEAAHGRRSYFRNCLTLIVSRLILLVGSDAQSRVSGTVQLRIWECQCHTKSDCLTSIAPTSGR